LPLGLAWGLSLEANLLGEPPTVFRLAYEKGEPDESASPLAEDSGTTGAVRAPRPGLRGGDGRAAGAVGVACGSLAFVMRGLGG